MIKIQTKMSLLTICVKNLLPLEKQLNFLG
jgi:hypothetical protein